MTATMSEADRLGLVMELAREKGQRPSSNDVRGLLSCGRATANKLLDELDRLDRPPAHGGPTLLPREAEQVTGQPAERATTGGPELRWATGPQPDSTWPEPPQEAARPDRPSGPPAGLFERLARLKTGPAAHPDRRAGHQSPIHRWWLVVLALPAFVAVWGGWVGLGGLAGLGPVELLPGIWDSLKVNLAVTLPAGMEVYAIIGLRVWLSTRTRRDRTRRFAAWSTCLALAVGCSGQVAYHVLARPVTGAPMFVTVCVACLPVAILGMGAALFHLVGDDQRETEIP